MTKDEKLTYKLSMHLLLILMVIRSIVFILMITENALNFFNNMHATL